MNIIKSRSHNLVLANGLGSSLTLSLLLNKACKNQGHVNPILILMLLPIPLLLFTLFILEYRKYKDAMLILDNEIIKIKVAKIEHKTSQNNDSFSTAEDMDASISCFGVLLDSKVIKFNQDKIILNSVVIQRDSISFVYGSKGVSERLTILHGVMDKEQIQNIVDRFRYETGIVPMVLDSD